MTFECDLQVARDGGFPFLMTCDERILDYLLGQEHEYRVRVSPIFTMDQIVDLMEFYIPNYFSIVFGTALVPEARNSTGNVRETRREAMLVLRKTQMSDVYHVLNQDGSVVSGNHIAYIPNLEVSRYIKRLLRDKQSAHIQCVYNGTRQKWTPKIQ